MVEYNKERTAYQKSQDHGGPWYLLPRGRKKAPILGPDGPFLSLQYSFCVDYITEEDRKILLDAEDKGVFSLVLREIEYILYERHDEEQARRRKVAQKILDSYRGD